MPHIRIRGLEKTKLLEISQDLVADVAEVSGAPVSHFTLECVATEFIVNGAVVQGEPFCEVLWFDRGQAVQDQTAQLITRHLKKMEPSKDAVVIFTILAPGSYYENGNHF